MVFSGLMSINENFVTQGEKQFFTDGKNLHVNNSELSIQVKNENAKGKAWSPKNGFVEQEFNITSGTLNTAKAFRFNQGRIEAKVNIQQSNSIIHGLSLKGEKITPHIDLIKTGKGNGYEVRYIPKDKKSIISHKVKGININDKYFIHALEWTEKELIWKLNGLEIAREAHQLNGEELYINMASIVEKAPESLPAEFKIDWIKVYKKQEDK
jgi:beta-glucanase (GH16 family)